MLLVLIILKLLFLPSNNNNFKLSFFPSFSFIFAFFAGIFAGVKEREKKKVGFVVTAEEVHPLTPGDS